jgi:LmbE family N-acetylglucosaminyl deacetylase
MARVNANLSLEPPDIRPLDLLAIAAHPGDAERWCGGTLARMAEQGYRTGILDLGARDLSQSGALAAAERAAGHLLLSWRGNRRFPEGRFDSTISVRMTLVSDLRRLRPRVVILPPPDAEHPDERRAAEIGREACFLCGIARLDEETPVHRIFKVIHAADDEPSFVVDISRQFGRRAAALAEYGADAGDLAARVAGARIAAAHGEAFLVREAIRIDDLVQMGVPSF